MLRALASEIPPEEPFILLEESRELGLHRNDRHKWVMGSESRDGHGERGADGRPAGEIMIADLIPVSLRMGAQRIIVGEVRSREIVPMLEAMTTSRGSMCTIHARTAASVTDRIIQLALSYGPSMTPDLAQRTAANGLDLIVYVNLADETGIGGRKHRFVAEHRGGHRNGAGWPRSRIRRCSVRVSTVVALLGTYPSASATISRGSVTTSASSDRGSMRDTVRGGRGSTRCEAADEPPSDRLHRRCVLDRWCGRAHRRHGRHDQARRSPERERECRQPVLGVPGRAAAARRDLG